MLCLAKSIMWYHVDSRNWKKLTELPEARIHHASCVLNGKIYITGESLVINIHVLFLNMRTISFDWPKHLYSPSKSTQLSNR